MEVTVLLGMDLSSRLFESLHFSTGKLVFKKKEAQTVRAAQQRKEPTAALIVGQSICIPGHSLREIPVKLLEPFFPVDTTLEVEAGSIYSTTGEIMHLDFAPHIRTSIPAGQGAAPYSIVIRNRDIRALLLQQGCVIGQAKPIPKDCLVAAPQGRYSAGDGSELGLATRPRVQVRSVSSSTPRAASSAATAAQHPDGDSPMGTSNPEETQARTDAASTRVASRIPDIYGQRGDDEDTIAEPAGAKSEFDINPELPQHQRELMEKMLRTLPEAFAKDPKKQPTVAPGVEHRIFPVSYTHLRAHE